jgi:hypothetical protein
MGTKIITYDERICLSLNPNFYCDKKENVITKKLEQGYGVRLYFKLLLNILNIIGALPLFIPL